MNLQKFNDQTVQSVWEMATRVPDYDPSIFRKDVCGAWMRRLSHGNRDDKYGWEVDHIKPVSKGGNDDLSNLQPLHWRNNEAKGDGDLVCVVRN